MNAEGSKRSYLSDCQALPDGALITRTDEPDAFLLWKNALFRWTPEGYDACRPSEPKTIVNVLTPPSIVRAIAAGYIPDVHPSALRLAP